MPVNYQMLWAPPAFAVPYDTGFPANEAELSEGGVWSGGLREGLVWTALIVSGGIVRGSQTGPAPATAGYNDSIGCLAGPFPADQRSTITIHRTGTIDSTTREAECLARFKITGNSARGIEFLYAYDGAYSKLVRWNGPKGNSTNSNAGFTERASGTPNGALANGDMLKLEAVGTTFTGYRSTDGGANWVQIVTCTDATYADGTPGMGLWQDGGSSNANLGVSHFRADSL